MIWTVPKMWDGGECFILGGGPSVIQEFGIPTEVVESVRVGTRPPSAYSRYLEPLHNRHVIGINNAYQIGTWIDICFFGDCAWYLVHRTSLINWPGLKVTCCPRFADKPKDSSEGIKCTPKDGEHRFGISTNPKKVAWNNNSGAASISLAFHLGVKRVVLLGFDMTLGDNHSSHWHGGHGNDFRRKSPFPRHLKGFPAIAEDAKKLGLEIINASPGSAIGEFPKVSVREVL